MVDSCLSPTRTASAMTSQTLCRAQFASRDTGEIALYRSKISHAETNERFYRDIIAPCSLPDYLFYSILRHTCQLFSKI